MKAIRDTALSLSAATADAAPGGALRRGKADLLQFPESPVLRTGGNSGIPDTVGNGLTASGQTLSDDYNEMLHGGGGTVVLANLQGGQRQVVYNGSGGGITVHPFGVGQIDGIAAYSLANTKTQIFTCYGILANGSPYYRSTQLG